METRDHVQRAASRFERIGRPARAAGRVLSRRRARPCRCSTTEPHASRPGRAPRWACRAACGLCVWISNGPSSATTGQQARPVRIRWPRAACSRAQRPGRSRGTAIRRSGPSCDDAGSGAAAYVVGNYAISARAVPGGGRRRTRDDAESLSNLGQVLVRLGKVEEAIPYFDRAIALIPQRWAYRFNLARALGLLGGLDEAVAGYREAQQLFPNDYATAFNLGAGPAQEGRRAGRGRRVQEGDRAGPQRRDVPHGARHSLERLQRRSEAAAAYDDYLQLAPSAPDAEQVRARIAQLSGQATPPPPGGSSTSGI